MENLGFYPIQYIEPIVLKDETLVQFRPIHPKDGKQAWTIKEKFSDESIYERFLGYIPPITEENIIRFTQIDYLTEMAIVAEINQEGQKEIVAIARLAKDLDGDAAEFAIIIADQCQGKGLGTIMTRYMIKIAKDLAFEKVYALTFSSNIPMLEILRREGFDFRKEDSSTTYAELHLN